MYLADLEALDIERKMLVLIIGKNGCQCPACGFVIERISGDDNMMCGCEARAAGGNKAKALRNGGCGHEFKFSSGAPNGTGSMGAPDNPRQWKFTPKNSRK